MNPGSLPPIPLTRVSPSPLGSLPINRRLPFSCPRTRFWEARGTPSSVTTRGLSLRGPAPRPPLAQTPCCCPLRARVCCSTRDLPERSPAPPTPRQHPACSLSLNQGYENALRLSMLHPQQAATPRPHGPPRPRQLRASSGRPDSIGPPRALGVPLPPAAIDPPAHAAVIPPLLRASAANSRYPVLRHSSWGSAFSDRLSSLVNWGVDRVGPFGRCHPECRARAPTGWCVRQSDPSITSWSEPSLGSFSFQVDRRRTNCRYSSRPTGPRPRRFARSCPFEFHLTPSVSPERASTIGARIVECHLIRDWVDRFLFFGFGLTSDGLKVGALYQGTRRITVSVPSESRVIGRPSSFLRYPCCVCRAFTSFVVIFITTH